MPQDARAFEEYKTRVARSQGKDFEEFMRFIWGDDERITVLTNLLDAKSVNNNIILTRGVCREVQECLRFTARNGKDHLGAKFSQVLDTQGDRATFRNNEWTDLSRLDMKGLSHRQPAHEIAKDLYIVKHLLRELERDQGSTGHKIVYLDDSPEVLAIERGGLTPEQQDRVVVFKLVKEANEGLTNQVNHSQLQAFQQLLQNSPAQSLHVVYDFDCTLTARHLYKTWSCAKYPQIGVVRFPQQARALDEFITRQLQLRRAQQTPSQPGPVHGDAKSLN